MKVLQIILVSLLSIVILFIMTKLMGNKQLSQMNTFDYIIGITVGSIAAEMATDLEDPVQPAVAMLIYGIFAVTISVLTNKSIHIRKFVSGKPLILLEKDTIYKEHLQKARMDLHEFLGIARIAGFYDIHQVETAVLEHNGKVSFLPKTQNRPVTPEDIKLPLPKEERIRNVIVDGHIMPDELGAMEKDMKWLQQRLKESGYEAEEDVFLATLDRNDELHFYPMEHS